MRVRPPNATGVAVGVLLTVLLGATAAVGQALVTSADIKDGTIASVDIKDGAVSSGDIKNGTIANADILDGGVTTADIKDGTVASGDIKNGTVASTDIADGTVASGDIMNGTVASTDIADGTIAEADLSAAVLDSLTVFSGPNWSIMDRNVIGAGDAFLRAGLNAGVTVAPPMGVGSLGIRTASGNDKAAFGNQVDFVDMPVGDLTVVSYSIFTTGENITTSPTNLPGIVFEIDPNLEGGSGTNFASMTFVPDPIILPGWTDIDATTTGLWGLTGDAGVETGCDLNLTLCTFDDLLAALDDGGATALIHTVSISKGRDFAFSGAVDALVINDQTFDFEPLGVVTTP